jgi:hypothetical protein
VETVLRSASLVNMSLTRIADRKAHIVIALNGLLISLVIGTYATRIAMDSGVAFRVGLVLLGCWASLLCAVLAAVPRTYRIKDLEERRRAAREKPLYFERYAALEEDEYLAVIESAMRDEDTLYDMMLTDLHSAGRPLTKKFRFLAASYVILFLTLATAAGMFIVLGYDLMPN